MHGKVTFFVDYDKDEDYAAFLTMITHLKSNRVKSIPLRAKLRIGTGRQLMNSIMLVVGLLVTVATLAQSVQASEEIPTFQRVPTQFIAALRATYQRQA